MTFDLTPHNTGIWGTLIETSYLPPISNYRRSQRPETPRVDQLAVIHLGYLESSALAQSRSRLASCMQYTKLQHATGFGYFYHSQNICIPTPALVQV